MFDLVEVKQLLAVFDCLFTTSSDTHEKQPFTDEASGLAAVSANHVSCSDCAKCG